MIIWIGFAVLLLLCITEKVFIIPDLIEAVAMYVVDVLSRICDRLFVQCWNRFFRWRKLIVNPKAHSNYVESEVVGIVATYKDKIIWEIEEPQKKVFYLVRLAHEYTGDDRRGYWYSRYYFITDGEVCYNVERKTEDDSIPDRNAEFHVEARPLMFVIARKWFDCIQEACARFSTQHA